MATASMQDAAGACVGWHPVPNGTPPRFLRWMGNVFELRTDLSPPTGAQYVYRHVLVLHVEDEPATVAGTLRALEADAGAAAAARMLENGLGRVALWATTPHVYHGGPPHSPPNTTSCVLCGLPHGDQVHRVVRIP